VAQRKGKKRKKEAGDPSGREGASLQKLQVPSLRSEGYRPET